MIFVLTTGAAVLAQEPMSKANQTKMGQLALSGAVTAALENNPAIKTARAKWESARQRIPQAAAWEDPKLTVNSLLGRFVDISRNGFADQMVTVEQMIPLTGKNRSKERIAAAEAVASFEDSGASSLMLSRRQRRAISVWLISICFWISTTRKKPHFPRPWMQPRRNSRSVHNPKPII